MHYNEVTAEYRTLKDLPLFSELTTEELRTIAAFSRIEKFRKNEMVFIEGDEFRGFYIVFRGTVKIYKLASSGAEAVLHLAIPYETFAEVPLFQGMSVYPANAQAIEETKLFLIPKQQYLQFIENHPKVSIKMITGLSQKLRQLTARIEDLTTREVNSRLAMFILSNIHADETTISLSISKSALAGYLGTITETLSRTFARMQKEGIINVNGKDIDILNLKALRKLAELK